MRAYSTDLRERVIRQWRAGKGKPELVSLFEVSIGSVRRWVKHYERTGQVAAKQRQSWRRTIGPEQEEHLRAQVERMTDATLEQHVVEWEKTQGQPVSLATMWRALKRIGWSLKKRQWEPSNVMKSSGPPFGSL